jgi:hypothetical protein
VPGSASAPDGRSAAAAAGHPHAGKQRAEPVEPTTLIAPALDFQASEVRRVPPRLSLHLLDRDHGRAHGAGDLLRGVGRVNGGWLLGRRGRLVGVAVRVVGGGVELPPLKLSLGLLAALAARQSASKMAGGILARRSAAIRRAISRSYASQTSGSAG